MKKLFIFEGVPLNIVEHIITGVIENLVNMSAAIRTYSFDDMHHCVCIDSLSPFILRDAQDYINEQLARYEDYLVSMYESTVGDYGGW